MPQSVVRVRCAEMKILKSGRDIGACLTGLEGTQAQSLRGYTNKMKLKILLIILTLLLCIETHLFHYKTNYTRLFHFFSAIQVSKRGAV